MASSSSAAAAVAPLRPVPSYPLALRVFGAINIRRVETNNLRRLAREHAEAVHAVQLRTVRSILHNQVSRYSHVPKKYDMERRYLPSLAGVSNADRGVVDNALEAWTATMTKFIYTRSYASEDIVKLAELDAKLDFFRILGDHIMILATIFKVACGSLSRYDSEHSCFWALMRLPREDNKLVMQALQVVGSNNVSDNPVSPSKWHQFDRQLTDHYSLYSTLIHRYETAADGHPPGQAHRIDFETIASYTAARRKPYEPESTPYSDELFSDSPRIRDGYPRSHLSRVYPYKLDEMDAVDAESMVSYHAMKLGLYTQHSMYRNVHPGTIHEEVLAAVIVPTERTVFIGGCASFTRVYASMQHIIPNKLPMYFEEVPELQQFTSLLRWAWWQLLHWDNTFYVEMAFDDQQWIEMEAKWGPQFLAPPLPGEPAVTEEDIARQAAERAAQKKEFVCEEHLQRQCGFPVGASRSFEDVIAATRFANHFTDLRQAMFAIFPPEVVKRHDTDRRIPYGEETLQEAFDREWKGRMTPEHRASLNPRGLNIDNLVNRVIKTLTFTQLIEKTEHIPCDEEFLSCLTLWQFSGTMKVNVMKYLITRMIPCKSTLETMAMAKHLTQPTIRVTHDTFFRYQITDRSVLSMFKHYAWFIKREQIIRATLFAANFIPALIKGSGKSPSQRIPGEHAIPHDVMEKIMLPMAGLSIERTTLTGTRRIMTQKEYIQRNEGLRDPTKIPYRRSPAFIRVPYAPLDIIDFRPDKNKTAAPTASVRSSDAVSNSGDSVSAKRSK